MASRRFKYIAEINLLGYGGNLRALGRIKTYKRSGITITKEKDSLKISIGAIDATALRASINSVLRDVQTIDRTAALFHKSQKK